MKGKAIKKTIERLLEREAEADPAAHRIVVSLLRDIYNEGYGRRSDKVQKHLYDLIDYEVRNSGASDGNKKH